MDYTFESIKQFLKKNLDSAKFKHSKGVALMAGELAQKHGVPVRDARLAGLLHDVGRIYGKQQLVRYAKKHQLKIPRKNDIMKYSPKLLHSFVGADIVKNKFTKNPLIVEAVAYHTLAKPRLNRFAKIIYVADYIAPDRRYPGVKKVRKQAMRDLDSAFAAALEDTLCCVMKKKQWLHPLAVKTWNEVIKTLDGKR